MSLEEHEYPMVRCTCRRVINTDHIRYYREMIQNDPVNGGKKALDKIGLFWPCCRDNIINVPPLAKSILTDTKSTILPKEIDLDPSTIIIRNGVNPGAVEKNRRYQLYRREIYTKETKELYQGFKKLYLKKTEHGELVNLIDPIDGYIIMRYWIDLFFPESANDGEVIALMKLMNRDWKISLDKEIKFSYPVYKTEKQEVKNSKGQIEGVTTKDLEVISHNVVEFRPLGLYRNNYVTSLATICNYIWKIKLDQVIRILALIPGKETLVIMINDENQELELFYTPLPLHQIVAKFISHELQWIGKFLRYRTSWPEFKNLEIEYAKFRYIQPIFYNFIVMGEEIIKEVDDPEIINQVTEIIKK